jgi:hypothetical protein
MRLKKMPAARKPAEMAALTRPARSHPRCMLMAALKNQAAAPTYQIQLKLRPTVFEMRPAGGTILPWIQGTAYSVQRSEKRAPGWRLVAGGWQENGCTSRMTHFCQNRAEMGHLGGSPTQADTGLAWATRLFPTPCTLFFRCATIPVSVGAGREMV